jgi:antitoxin CptB
MSEMQDLEKRRKRLRFRSWHRGTREMDLLVGSFADRYVDGFDHDQLDRFEALLLESDPLIYNWIVGRETPPAELESDVLTLLCAFDYKPSID